MYNEVEKALLAIIPVLAGVLATGLVGSGLGYWWNLQLKRREADLATMKTFHELYGEFFAVWKLWNYYARDIGPERFLDASRWKLLERACAAEGRMEAILIDLSSKYHSDLARWKSWEGSAKFTSNSGNRFAATKL